MSKDRHIVTCETSKTHIHNGDSGFVEFFDYLLRWDSDGTDE